MADAAETILHFTGDLHRRAHAYPALGGDYREHTKVLFKGFGGSST